MNNRILLLFAVWLTGTVNADGGAPVGGIRVSDAWSRATPPGIGTGAAYFVIGNRGQSDRLLRVSSPVAARAEIHVSKMVGEMMTMHPLDAVDVNSGDSVSFAPGGRHVMLLGLTHSLKEGEAFPLVLTFKNAGPVEVQVHVRGIGAAAAGDRPMEHSK